MSNLTKKITIGSVLLAAVIGVGLRANIIKLPITIESEEHLFIEGLSDDRVMLGASHNVFIGKILRVVGAEDAMKIGPVTQFEVEVLDNIKGDLKGTVIVQQESGYRNGILYTYHGGKLMEPGETYLLATRYYQERDWYHLSSHPNGSKLLSRNTKLDKESLQKMAQDDSKVKSWKEAYKNEILLEADILENNARNSYQSLQIFEKNR